MVEFCDLCSNGPRVVAMKFTTVAALPETIGNIDKSIFVIV